MELNEALASIKPIDKSAAAAAKKHWLEVVKPLFALGRLEDAISQIAGIKGRERFTLDKKGLVIMCADNGVVDEGVTQCGREITANVTDNFTKGKASSCIMAKTAGADIIPIDIGVAADVPSVTIPEKKVMYGTRNMTRGAAMTREEAVRAIEIGIDTVIELSACGYDLLATGEMGIGNTTTSGAVTAVLLEKPAEEVTGRGAGLSSEGLVRKIDAVKRAISVNKPNKDDPIDVVSKVGGLDIAGLMGVYIGGALCHIPVIVDGFISGTAALAAVRLCPNVRGYILASHVSSEPAGRMILDALELEPYITCGMFLGEGTGALAVMPLFDMALDVYTELGTFDNWEYDAYRVLT